jgi:hypothetical protein
MTNCWYPCHTVYSNICSPTLCISNMEPEMNKFGGKMKLSQLEDSSMLYFIQNNSLQQ